MWTPVYWTKTYWTNDYWPTFATTAATGGGGVVQYLDVGGDGITMIGVGFVTLTLSFPNGISMRTE